MENPDVFLGLDPDAENWVRTTAKANYDYSLHVLDTSIAKPGVNVLTDLLVDGFENEQIWQQIDLYNTFAISRHEHFLSEFINLKSAKKDPKVSIKNKKEKKSASSPPAAPELQSQAEPTSATTLASVDENDSESEEEKELEELLKKVTGRVAEKGKDSEDEDDYDDLLTDNDNEDNDEDDEPDSDRDAMDCSADDNLPVEKLKSKIKNLQQRATTKPQKSAVDDTFFKLAEVEAFLDEQDRKAEKHQQNGHESEESDNLSDEDDDSNQVEASYMYSDFFDPPDCNNVNNKQIADKSKKKPKAVGSDDEDNDGAVDIQSEVEDEDDDDDPSKASGDDKDSGDSDDDEDDDDDDNGDDDNGDGDSDDAVAKSVQEESDNETESDSDDEDTNVKGKSKSSNAEEKSSFEQRQEKLRRQIAALEKSNLQEKSWQMKGEVFAATRPENSMLQEVVDFDYMTRQAPVITEETTKRLEDIIIQRIKDKAWDDVERRERPTNKMLEYSKRQKIELDDSKSKLSLGEIYEQQFLKQASKSDGNEEEKEDPKHAEIRTMMQSLFVKLDALANFHYMPKPVMQDVKIMSNVPALSMEEAIPSAVSDATLLAPEEVQTKSKREFVGSTETTKTDRKRARRLKKKLQHEKRLKREKKDKLKKAPDSKTSKDDSAEKPEKKRKKMNLGKMLNESMPGVERKKAKVA